MLGPAVWESTADLDRLERVLSHSHIALQVSPTFATQAHVVTVHNDLFVPGMPFLCVGLDKRRPRGECWFLVYG